MESESVTPAVPLESPNYLAGVRLAGCGGRVHHFRLTRTRYLNVVHGIAAVELVQNADIDIVVPHIQVNLVSVHVRVAI